MNLTTDLAKRTSLNELCEAWILTQNEIRAACAMLTAAQQRLCMVFDTGGGRYGSFRVFGTNQPDLENADQIINHLQRKIWGALTDRLELRRVLSLARIAELDKQIETGEGLPPITYANILTILETQLGNAPQYLQEKVFEVYEWLRPGGWQRSKYKTNEKSYEAGVGAKVIKGYVIERRYSGGYSVCYSSRDKIRALDQVFHMLDGAPMAAATHAGPLCDAIEAQTGPGGRDAFETAYFRGRCFRNRNLHLEFVRADLLQKFNEVAGGYRLKPKNGA